MWVRLPPVLLEDASVGHWQASLAVNQSSERTLAVRLRGGALTTWPVRLMAGYQALNLATRVRLPYGLLTAKWWNGRHATLRPSCPYGRGSSTLPFVTDAGLAGAWLAVMRPVRPARYRGLQLRKAESGKRKADTLFRFRLSALRFTATGYANWQSDQVESLVILRVRLPPRSLT